MSVIVQQVLHQQQLHQESVVLNFLKKFSSVDKGRISQHLPVR